MKYIKFITTAIKFIIKLGPVLFTVIEAAKLVSDKLDEINKENALKEAK